MRESYPWVDPVWSKPCRSSPALQLFTHPFPLLTPALSRSSSRALSTLLAAEDGELCRMMEIPALEAQRGQLAARSCLGLSGDTVAFPGKGFGVVDTFLNDPFSTIIQMYRNFSLFFNSIHMNLVKV